jgi:hypothetical protein
MYTGVGKGTGFKEETYGVTYHYMNIVLWQCVFWIDACGYWLGQIS